MNYQTLKTELQNVSYNGMTDAQAAAAVNAKTVSTPQPALLDVNKVKNAIVAADFTSLTQLQVTQMTFLLTGNGTVDASPGTMIRLVFQSIFSGKTTTLANLSALVSPFDNATTLWVVVNLGTTLVTDHDVNVARAS